MKQRYKFPRCLCPEPGCGEKIPANWMVRHLREKHPIETSKRKEEDVRVCGESKEAECHLVGLCQDCYWHLPDFGGSCRMVLWGARQLDIARETEYVTIVQSFSLKVESEFGCALWKPKANSDV